MSSPPPAPWTPPHPSPTSTYTETLFGYDPSIALAIAFASIFLVFFLLQLVLYALNRPDGYMLVLAFTALVGECAGYAIRAFTIHHANAGQDSKGPFIISLLCILLSPCFIALVNYIVCGRALAFSKLNVGCLRPQWISRVFLLSDIITFLIQGLGGSMTISSNESTAKLGKNIATAGLILQILSFCLFFFVAFSIHAMPRYGLNTSPAATKLFTGIYLTMGCLIIRTTYHIVAFESSAGSTVDTHEWPFYAFDASVITVAYIVFSIPPMHYGLCLNTLTAEKEAGSFDHITLTDVQPYGAPMPATATYTGKWGNGPGTGGTFGNGTVQPTQMASYVPYSVKWDPARHPPASFATGRTNGAGLQQPSSAAGGPRPYVTYNNPISYHGSTAAGSSTAASYPHAGASNPYAALYRSVAPPADAPTAYRLQSEVAAVGVVTPPRAYPGSWTPGYGAMSTNR